MMPAQIISGKEAADSIKAELALEVERLAERGVVPGLAVILVGDDPASRVYVNNKKKDCAALGIYSEEYALPEDTSQQQLEELIGRLNGNDRIHGILVQLPLPGHLDEQRALACIAPEKDADAFHAMNMGRLLLGRPGVLPCTPAGVMELIHRTGVPVGGANCVVIGRSNIVGKPMAMLLLRENGTVTICHSRTKELSAFTRRADILVAAVGRANFVTADMVKPGAVVVDVGMNRDKAGKLCGDVAFEEVSRVAGFITPVPGGVGPMTIAMLMKNTVEAAKRA